MNDDEAESPAAASSPPGPEEPEAIDEHVRPLPMAALWVEEVRIRNFRGLPDLVLRLERDLTILVGRNNAGKSRILRAISLALGAGGVRADRDDFPQLIVSPTVPNPEIDVIVAPAQAVGDGTDTSQHDDSSDVAPPVEQPAERFDKGLADELRPQLIDPVADRSRWAFRTTVRGSMEGLGAQVQRHVLTYTATTGWALPRNPTSVTSGQLRLLEATLIGDRRDLATDLTARGSAIARILDDLEVPDDVRPKLEGQLRAVSDEIATQSASLRAVRDSVQGGSSTVGGIGKPVLNPLPPTLEELSRFVSVDLDTGSGALPLRLHGSGARSLSSMLVHGVVYERRSGRDGLGIGIHPITLVEEPEAHLHPQMQHNLPDLLRQLPGQVVVATHSSHLVAEVEARSLRLVRPDAPGGPLLDVNELIPGEAGADSSVAEATTQLPQPLTRAEQEKMVRLVERPFGELLFASAVVVGDGATERALLPALIRHALPDVGYSVSVVDPTSLDQHAAVTAVLKFARAMGVPWFMFVDHDNSGRKAVSKVRRTFGLTPDEIRGSVIWVAPDDGVSEAAADSAPTSRPVSDGNTDTLLVAFDEPLVRDVALTVLGYREDEGDETPTTGLLEVRKGIYGRPTAQAILATYPNPSDWPTPIRDLVSRIRASLETVEEADDAKE